jgi:hypothetical protein
MPVNGAAWITNVNISPANPLTTNTTATVTGINNNVVYNFAVDNICSNGIATSNVYQAIVYSTQTLSHTVSAGVISVNQNPLLTIDSIQYRLKNNSSNILSTIITTGTSPSVSFPAQSSGNYTVEWRYGATVNGVTLYSDDPSEAGAWYVSGTITI